MSGIGLRLPTCAVQQVCSYLGYGGHQINVVVTAARDLGCVKTRTDLVILPSGGRILRFFALSVITSLKIPGAIILRRVFTQPGPIRETSARQPH
jgi:hypothetical protein